MPRCLALIQVLLFSCPSLLPELISYTPQSVPKTVPGGKRTPAGGGWDCTPAGKPFTRAWGCAAAGACRDCGALLTFDFRAGTAFDDTPFCEGYQKV